MELNDLLQKNGLDPGSVLVLRHSPPERKLKAKLPWLAAERPLVFNAYQQSHSEKVEKALLKATHVASFIGHEPGRALFAGLYSIGAARPLTYDEFWKIPANDELKKLGMTGFTGERPSVLWFDLTMTDFYDRWKGRLVIEWPAPEIAWYRRADRNVMPVIAVLGESALNPVMPVWDDVTFSWDDLAIIPERWKAELARTRGIYYIFDESDSKGYVGSAYGEENLLGRWQDYAVSGHGGNALLRKRDPRNFHFSILQRLGPDADPEELARVERTWKKRLHTIRPFGLNDNN